MTKLKQTIFLIVERVTKNRPPFINYYEFDTEEEKNNFAMRILRILPKRKHL